jgi:hypothetical protein
MGSADRTEIRPGDKWRDSHGLLITVETVMHNRVTYLRDGYTAPCFCTPDRLRREFEFVSPSPEATSDIARFMAAGNSSDKIRMMREIIQNRRTRK